MTEEEYFRKNNPDFWYGDKPLSPYWDFFQDGIEFGERQSEKKIEELEKENEELRKNGFTVSAMTEQQLKAALEKGEQLENENAELKMKIYGGGYEMIITKKHADIILLEKQLEELKADNDARKYAMAMSEKVEKQLREQLTKAKEIIRELIDLGKIWLSEEDDDYSFIKRAEQFLGKVK